MKLFFIVLVLVNLLFACTSSDATYKVEQEEGFAVVEVGEGEIEVSFEQDSALLLPIFRNYTPDKKDYYKETALNAPLGEQLGVFLAKVKVKPNGNTAIDYVLKKQLPSYQKTKKELFLTALNNLEQAQLTIKGMQDEASKDELVLIESKIGLSTALLFDFEFLESTAEQLQTPTLSIAILNSSTVFITTPKSSFEASFKDMALEMEYVDVVHLHSALYSWEVGSTEFELVELYKE